MAHCLSRPFTRLDPDPAPRLAARIIGVSDVSATQATTRSDRAAMPNLETVEIARANRHSWRGEVAVVTEVGTGHTGRVERPRLLARARGVS